jgi:hypothetical protein
MRADDLKPAREFVPFGPGLATQIPFRNSGKGEALAKQVILSNGTWARTPHRKDIHGAGEAIHAFFEPRHYVQEKKEYVLALQKPASIPGEQWTTLEVAIVDPNKVGQTYTCTVTLVFDGLEQIHFEGVQLDAMGRAPDKDSP